MPAKLKNIGTDTPFMRGSLNRIVKPVVVQRLPAPTHDARFQIGPGEAVPQLFSAYWPGIDPLTGKPWRAA